MTAITITFALCLVSTNACKYLTIIITTIFTDERTCVRKSSLKLECQNLDGHSARLRPAGALSGHSALPPVWPKGSYSTRLKCDIPK